MIELRNDQRTHTFDKDVSNSIFEQVLIKNCRFCNGDLNPDEAAFYQHDGGWQTSAIKEKVWIWFTCKKCNHQWGLNYLGVSKNSVLSVHPFTKILEEGVN